MASKKTVLITAGNRGLGKALVDAFHDAGWTVLATARRPEMLAEKLEKRLTLDLSKKDTVDTLVSEIKGKYSIDLIIHNAGFNPKDVKGQPGYFESTFTVKDFSADNVAESCMINALLPMELTGKLSSMLTDSAAVIAISSWLGSMTKKNIPGHYGYSGSKTLMNMMMKGLSMEWESTNKAALAINPGWLKTDMGGPNAEETPEEAAQAIRRMAEDVTFLKASNGKFLNTDRSEHPW